MIKSKSGVQNTAPLICPHKFADEPKHYKAFKETYAVIIGIRSKWLLQ